MKCNGAGLGWGWAGRVGVGVVLAALSLTFHVWEVVPYMGSLPIYGKSSNIIYGTTYNICEVFP